jgi:hypothetical protein
VRVMRPRNSGERSLPSATEAGLSGGMESSGALPVSGFWPCTSGPLQNAHDVPVVDGQLAPPHPDVQGQNPETGSAPVPDNHYFVASLPSLAGLASMELDCSTERSLPSATVKLHGG